MSNNLLADILGELANSTTLEEQLACIVGAVEMHRIQLLDNRQGISLREIYGNEIERNYAELTKYIDIRDPWRNRRHDLWNAIQKWIRLPHNSVEELLFLILSVDDWLSAFGAPDIDSGPHPMPPRYGGGSICFWINPPAVFNIAEAGIPSLPEEHFDRVNLSSLQLRHCLDTLRYTRNPPGLPHSRVVNKHLLNEVTKNINEHIEALAAQEQLTPHQWRVGLYVVRSEHKYVWVRKPSTPLQIRAKGITGDKAAFMERIRKIARASCSNGEAPVDFLVLPELAVPGQAKSALIDEYKAASRNGERPPIITFAGSWYNAGDKKGEYRNSCEMLDSRGNVLATQSKRYRYLSKLPNSMSDFVIDDESSVSEAIYQADEMWFLPTAAGCFSVLICLDAIRDMSDALRRIVIDSSCEWIVIPSYTPQTNEFELACKEFSKDQRTVLFTTSIQPITKPGEYAVTMLWPPNRKPVKLVLALTSSRDSPRRDLRLDNPYHEESARLVINDPNSNEGLWIEVLPRKKIS